MLPRQDGDVLRAFQGFTVLRLGSLVESRALDRGVAAKRVVRECASDARPQLCRQPTYTEQSIPVRPLKESREPYVARKVMDAGLIHFVVADVCNQANGDVLAERSEIGSLQGGRGAAVAAVLCPALFAPLLPAQVSRYDEKQMAPVSD